MTTILCGAMRAAGHSMRSRSRGSRTTRQRARAAFAPLFHLFAGQPARGASSRLAPFLRGGPPRPSESVEVAYPSPGRAELDVTMESPGLVVLADIFYPGWELTIDGVPAPIYRVNRAMRGAAVAAGHHRLVYTYDPRSFRVGLVVSAVGIAAMVLLALACALRPIEPAADASPSVPAESSRSRKNLV